MIASAIRLIALCVALVSGTAESAHAAAGAWATNERVSARLVSAVEATGELRRLPLGLELHLQPGWKTYWRSPGVAGLAPQIDFGTTSNIIKAVFAYPIPHRFTVLGIDTLGYKDDVVLPLDLEVAQPGQAANLTARLDLLVCSQICVPDTLTLSLVLPAGDAMPGNESGLLNRFASMVPGNGKAAGLEIGTVRIIGTGKSAMLEIEARAREPFQAPDVFAEAENASFGRPVTTLSDAGHTALIRLPVSNPGNAALTLTLADGLRAVEASPRVVAAPLPTLTDRIVALLPMLWLGLIGGFILNFMPCVLPVLSLKLLSVVSQGGRQKRQIRAGFLASAAGILFSFLVMAMVLIALKAGGQTIGWGIQFQQPIFLTAMIGLLCLFACNLAGLFEISLPATLTNRLGQAGETGYLGHFFQGAFATLLATPCSAPFLGTAVGFALASGTLEILAVFLALGIGLALPWLIVAAKPSLASRLPRPGIWMVRLRQFLAAVLALTAAWFLNVLNAQTGPVPTALLTIAMAAMAGAMYAQHRSGFAALNTGSARFAIPLLVASLVGASLVSWQKPDQPTSEIGWQRFDPDAIRSLVSQGKTVMVDVTADWCLTCQANKRLVLDQGPVAALLGKSIVAMKADWTRPDDKITAFLARYGKFGIPFNIIYGPGAPAGIVLPELLTDSSVKEAVAKAQKSG